MSRQTGRDNTDSLKLAVFDWAGTTVDYGCMAPAAVFIEGFRRKGVSISMQQARAPMGMEKRAHIAAIAAMPEVAALWKEVHGQPMGEEDIDEMYEVFAPLLLDVLAEHSQLIPGTVDTMAALRQRGMRIAGTTGYFKEAMDVVAAAAARQGYTPDISIASTEVPAGRPAPWLIFRAMEQLRVYPPRLVVKIGDTRPDVEAGLNAGVWTIGLAQTGNEVGLTEVEWQALSDAARAKNLENARQVLADAGAHYVVDGIWDLPDVFDEINRRLVQGEKP